MLRPGRCRRVHQNMPSIITTHCVIDHIINKQNILYQTPKYNKSYPDGERYYFELNIRYEKNILDLCMNVYFVYAVCVSSPPMMFIDHAHMLYCVFACRHTCIRICMRVCIYLCIYVYVGQCTGLYMNIALYVKQCI